MVEDVTGRVKKALPFVFAGLIGTNIGEAIRMTTGTAPEYRLSKFDRIATSPVKGKLVTIGIILAAFLVAMLVCIPFMSFGSMCMYRV